MAQLWETGLCNSGPQGLNTIHSDIYYGIEHILWFKLTNDKDNNQRELI